jgi:CspA family cold shock protein
LNELVPSALLLETAQIPQEGTHMADGTVKWFNDDKGYGFIEVSGGGNDAFVHVNNLAPGTQIAEGDRVTFDLEEGQKGPQAVNVTAAS